MILFKKAARSIWRSKRSYIACVVLMAVGVAMYVSFNMVCVNLSAARDKMYDDQRFADVFAVVRGMPVNAAEDLGRLGGIEKAGASIAADARVVLGGKEEKLITLRIHSFDPNETEPLNAFLLTGGTAPSENEILVGDSFFKANNLKIGDTLKLIVAGKQIRPQISGTALSPEYVYSIPDTGQLMPDNETFGFAYITYGQLATLTGESGLADRLAFKLKQGVGFDDVKYTLEDELAPYGLINLFEQKNQSSAAMLDQEISSMSSVATSLPSVFIMMAVIMLYIMLKRVIEQERGSIGTLKAFGFSDFEVLTHYLCYGLIAGAAGGILGILGGVAMIGGYTSIFLDYFNLPAFSASLDPMLLVRAVAISGASGALGAFMGTRGVLKLNPSEAMRPPAPGAVTGDILGSLPFIRIFLASNGYMAMRNIARSRFRSLFIILGISFSFALIGLMSSYPDMMDKMLVEQFNKVQLYDVKVNLKEPKPYTAALESVYAVDGVSGCEATLEVPCELRHYNRKEGVVITGLADGSRLQKIYDSEGGFYVQPPKGGLILSASLAKKIGAARGDILMAKTIYTGDDEIPLPILGIVNEALGMTAYMEISSLCETLGVPISANSVLIESSNPAVVKSALESADNVSSVTDKNVTRRVYDEMLVTYSSMFTMMQFAGMAVAYAIIANTSSISMSERKREYATLRVLGMHPREIGKILGFEYWFLTIIGILPGIPLLRAIKAAMANMMDTSLFTIPLSTPLSSYITAAAGCFITVFICNLLSSRQIAGFDMVEVLKERE